MNQLLAVLLAYLTLK